MDRLTPEEFHGVAKGLGYTLAEVASLWGLTPTRISQIAKDPRRKRLYDAALWGLPRKRLAAATTAKRRKFAAAHTVRKARKVSRPLPAVVDIWNALTQPGAVYAVNADQGEHLPEGCEGVVQERSTRAGTACVTIRFTTGYKETFEVSYLKDPGCFLTATGR